MANLGTRLFNGAGDRLTVPLAEIAGTALCPSTWLFAGRMLGAAGEIIADPAYAAVDLFYDGANGVRFFDGTNASPNNNPALATGIDAIVVQSLPSTGVMRYSIATHNGSVWSAFTHGDSAYDPLNPTIPSTGGLIIGDLAPLNFRLSLLGHTSAVLSDADRNTLTTNLPAWLALPNLTNLIRGDTTPVTDLVGGWDQSALTGTSVLAANFPLDDGVGGGFAADPPLLVMSSAVVRASRW